MTHNEDSRHDRYTIEVYCQHCGTYLNTLVGIEHNRVSAVRAQLREMAQRHANEIGRETEFALRVIQERRVWFAPNLVGWVQSRSSRPPA